MNTDKNLEENKKELSPEELAEQKYHKNKALLADDEKLYLRMQKMKETGSKAGWRGDEDERELQKVIERYTALGNEIAEYEKQRGLRP